MHTLPVITVNSVPGTREAYCRVTLNLPWETAQQIASIVAPMLASISKSVETRTLEEITRAQEDRRWRERHDKEKRKYLLHLYLSLKRIHQEKLSYSAWMALQSPAQHIVYGLKQRDLHRMYHRIRAWSIQWEKRKGSSVKDIAVAWKITPTAVYTILK